MASTPSYLGTPQSSQEFVPLHSVHNCSKDSLHSFDDGISVYPLDSEDGRRSASVASIRSFGSGDTNGASLLSYTEGYVNPIPSTPGGSDADNEFSIRSEMDLRIQETRGQLDTRNLTPSPRVSDADNEDSVYSEMDLPLEAEDQLEPVIPTHWSPCAEVALSLVPIVVMSLVFGLIILITWMNMKG